tara:strand:- start:152 stop:313 length:162 start_codon:yes stop_codon:yes gene_type:complete
MSPVQKIASSKKNRIVLQSSALLHPKNPRPGRLASWRQLKKNAHGNPVGIGLI